MREWVIINGSPRKGMNTDNLLERLMKTDKLKNDSFEIFKLSDHTIGPCKACTACIKLGHCIINDDLKIMLDAIKKKRKLICVSPSYHYNVTAQMKCFLDRLFSLHAFSEEGHSSRLEDDVKAILIGLCAGDNSGLGFTLEAMRRPLEDLEVQVIAEYKYLNTKVNAVRNNPFVEDELNNLLKDVL